MSLDGSPEPLESTEHAAGIGPMDSGPNLQVLHSHFFEFPDPVIATDINQRIVFLNRAAEDLVGRSAFEGPPLLFSDIMETEVQGREVSHAQHVPQVESMKDAHVRLRRREGEWITLSATSTAIKTGEGHIEGCVTILRNVQENCTSLVKDQEKLAMLTSILDNFPTPFFTVDSNLLITYMNQHLEVLTGYTHDEVVNRLTCSEVFSTAQCSTKDCILKQSMATRHPISGERRMILDRKGRNIHVVVHGSIITDRNNKVMGGFEAIRDITPIVEAEQKIKLLTEMTQEGILMVDQDHYVIFVNNGGDSGKA